MLYMVHIKQFILLGTCNGYSMYTISGIIQRISEINYFFKICFNLEICNMECLHVVFAKAII